MATLYVFCGLPGCGKSTKAEEFKRFYGESVEVVSTDAIREEVFGDIHTQEHNTEVFNIAYKRIKEFSETKEVVIFDATNTTMKSRKRIFNCGIDDIVFGEEKAKKETQTTSLENFTMQDIVQALQMLKTIKG